ncbi:uncharacterized protein EKO05_0004693 [Ascochyta rabiei]|uniref:Uncharacterized protein n=1 Tax=Didymella rabiei TaxID=5454 RepID=A0A163KPV7_DIDRA|nr:uncharacterized protein EKO05_0004693 [Ascochyta rabiei]KZM27157.1 hypothetical protein ST47_g1678 [Ascochyta rabiei]UPX14203.1 hypothetical protein EKO05_0004693 [Ascochyta rabiei]
MAPDLNSVPVSPRPSVTSNPSHAQTGTTSSRQNSTPASRRASQIYPMSPPPLPLASPGGTLPPATQHTHAFPPLSPNLPGADASHIPIRHPRPMTAAEMHLELEKEQEAVVNRLTRELSALRAHSASVASTTSSSASNALLDVTDPAGSAAHSGAPLQGTTHPTSSRRHRSSSSVSRSGLPMGTHSIPHSHRQSISSQQSGAEMRRSSSIVSTPRYEEVALHRAELEEAKKENEVLKQRIRELERAIRGGEESARGRSGAPTSES